MAPDATAESAPTKAIRLRHPWRTVLAVVLILMFAAFVIDPAGRPAYDWPSVAKYIFDRRISLAAVNTLQLMTYSMAMAMAIVLGVILAVMRLTQNPVVKSIAWFYLRVFRGTPVNVQLVFWGLLAVIYQSIDIGTWSGCPSVNWLDHCESGAAGPCQSDGGPWTLAVNGSWRLFEIEGAGVRPNKGGGVMSGLTDSSPGAFEPAGPSRGESQWTVADLEWARKRIQGKQKLRADVVAFAVINVFLIGVWAVAGAGYFWPGWVLAGWGVLLLLDAWNLHDRKPITEDDLDHELRSRK